MISGIAWLLVNLRSPAARHMVTQAEALDRAGRYRMASAYWRGARDAEFACRGLTPP